MLVTVILDALTAPQITEHDPTIDVDDVCAAAAYGATPCCTRETIAAEHCDEDSPIET